MPLYLKHLTAWYAPFFSFCQVNGTEYMPCKIGARGGARKFWSAHLIASCIKSEFEVMDGSIAGVALFVMNRPEAKNAISKNFLNLVRKTQWYLQGLFLPWTVFNMFYLTDRTLPFWTCLHDLLWGLDSLCNISNNSLFLVLPLVVCNGNRTEWSTIQGVIGRVISNQLSA